MLELKGLEESLKAVKGPYDMTPSMVPLNTKVRLATLGNIVSIRPLCEY